MLTALAGVIANRGRHSKRETRREEKRKEKKKTMILDRIRTSDLESKTSTSPHLTSPLLTFTSPHLTSPHLTSPHLTSPHLTSPHLTSPHLTSPHLTSPYKLRKEKIKKEKRKQKQEELDTSCKSQLANLGMIVVRDEAHLRLLIDGEAVDVSEAAVQRWPIHTLGQHCVLTGNRHFLRII